VIILSCTSGASSLLSHLKLISLKSSKWWPPAWTQQGPDVRVTPVVDSNTNPLPLCLQSQAGLRNELAQHLNRHVLGQPDAVRRIADAVMDKLSGVAHLSKPTVIVSAGPSGHGKTHLVKYLVESLFGDLSPQQMDTLTTGAAAGADTGGGGG
jgi:hypothetical protein